MPSILVLSRKLESANVMKSFLCASNMRDITCIQDVSEARMTLQRKAFDIIIVDLPYTMDKHELSFVLSLSEAGDAFIIVLIKKEQYPMIRDKVEKFGVFTVSKPILADVFTQVLSFATAAKQRYQQYQVKNEKLLDKISEIKFVDRAKCLLIEHEYMSEAQAHKYIEKQAMNERMTRKSIAEQVIQKYEEG